jgi:hypothetical protein
MDQVATTTFESGSPPGQYRHHKLVLGILALINVGLSILIWLYVPNDLGGPIFGDIFHGLRDALLALVWITFAIFTAASTAALSIIPGRWHNAIRLLLAYVVGLATLVLIAWWKLRG